MYMGTPKKSLDNATLSGDELIKTPIGDILIQATDPGGEMSTNWLPGPASGPLNLTFRVYIPGESVLQGSWMPPSIIAGNCPTPNASNDF